MFRKRRRRIIVFLIVMGVASLSCNMGVEANAIRIWLCEATSGTWVSTGEFLQGECKRQKISKTDEGPPSAADQQDIGDSVNQSVPDDGEANLTGNEEAPADNQGHIFLLDDCSCNGVSVPLHFDSSTASNNILKVGIKSGGQVESTGHLTCDWRGDYQSENKTGMIRIYLNVTKFDNAQYAQTLFTELHNDIASQLSYCEAEPDRCTVAIADFGEERSFYVYKNIYVGGKGELPSDHGAIMARLITAAGKFYVLDFFVTHPELETSDNWAVDISQAVEACIESTVSR